MSLSEDLRARARADRAARRLRPARGALRALPLGRATAPARPRRGLPPSRRRASRPSRAARSASCASSASNPRSARTTAARSTARQRYQLHVEGGADALRVLHDAGVLDARHAPVGAAAATRRPPLVLPARLPARRAARRRLAERPALTASRDPRDRARRRRVPRRARDDGRARRLACSTAAVTPWPTRRGRRRSRTCSPPPARATPCSLFEERAVVGATRARANRLANADHANLVRTSRAAHRQAQAVRRLVAGRPARHDAAAAPRGGRAPPPASVAVAARARFEMPAAGHEGGAPPAPGEGRSRCRVVSAVVTDRRYEL